MIAETIDRNQPLPGLSQVDVAEFYTKFREPLTPREVRTIEQAALRKLARLPEMLQFLPDLLAETKPRPLNFRE
jgi:hypothetical protein